MALIIIRNSKIKMKRMIKPMMAASNISSPSPDAPGIDPLGVCRSSVKTSGENAKSTLKR
jgi:hypothetical protein